MTIQEILDSPVEMFNIEKFRYGGATVSYEFTYAPDQWMAVTFYESDDEPISKLRRASGLSEQQIEDAFGDNTPFTVDFTTVEFGPLNQKDGNIEDYHMTNKGKPFIIISGVAICIRKYLDLRPSCNILRFIADTKDHGRVRSYRTLSLKLAKEWGAKRFVTSLYLGEQEAYTLIRGPDGFEDYYQKNKEVPLVSRGRYYH
jgi:hypothetical protein